MKEIERWKAEMPREEEMRPKDKYTIFDRKEKRYRKGIHSELIPATLWGFGGPVLSTGIGCAADVVVNGTLLCCYGRKTRVIKHANEIWFIELPKWTRVSQRINPPGF